MLKEPSQMAAVGTGAMGAFTSYARGDMGGVFKSVTGLGAASENLLSYVASLMLLDCIQARS